MNNDPNAIGFGTIANVGKLVRKEDDWIPENAGNSFQRTLDENGNAQLRPLPSGGAFAYAPNGSATFLAPQQAMPAPMPQPQMQPPLQSFGGGNPVQMQMQQPPMQMQPQQMPQQTQFSQGNPFLQPRNPNTFSPSQQLILQQMQAQRAMQMQEAQQQQALLRNAQGQQMRSRIGHVLGTLAGAAFGGVGGAYAASQGQPRYSNAVAQAQAAIAQHPITVGNNVDLLKLFADQDPSNPANQASLAQRYNEYATGQANIANQQHDNGLADKQFAETQNQNRLAQTNTEKDFGLRKTNSGVDNQSKLHAMVVADKQLEFEHQQAVASGNFQRAQALQTQRNWNAQQLSAQAKMQADREDKMAEQLPGKDGAKSTDKYNYAKLNAPTPEAAPAKVDIPIGNQILSFLKGEKVGQPQAPVAPLSPQPATVNIGGAQKAGIKYGYSKGYADVANHPGLVEPGNIDLSKRQIVDNPDGSYGTEFSGSANDGKNEVLVPTIYDGKHHSFEEAFQHYKQTGQHLGKFASGDIQNIDSYATKLHNRQILVDGKPYRGAATAAQADPIKALSAPVKTNKPTPAQVAQWLRQRQTASAQ